MLLSYILKRLYAYFAVLFLLLIIIFASGDLVLRLSTLPSLSFIPVIFICIMPLVGILAFPLAASLAVQLVVAQWCLRGSRIVFSYLAHARRTLVVAVMLFSASLLCLYIPLIFSWGPASYLRAKRIIVSFAKGHLSRLEAGRFHYPTPHLAIFFKRKNIELASDSVRFYDVLIMVNNAEQSYVLSAASGLLNGGTLHLENGTVQNLQHEKMYLATFQHTVVNIDQLMKTTDSAPASGLAGGVDTKFLTLGELLEIKQNNKKALSEYHARVVKIAWQFILPLIALYLMIFFASLYQSNLFLSVSLSGMLFFTTFFAVNISQIFWRDTLTVLAVMYGVNGGLLLLFCLVLFHKKRRVPT